MTPHLTIAYITARKDPKIQWFLDSLENQIQQFAGERCDGQIIIVDAYSNERKLQDQLNGFFKAGWLIKHVSVKPCVWQGEHRLTKENWFAASNARNTALCLAPDGYIAYIDDLSVLCPGWLLNVRQSMAWNGITLGTYRKVRNLVVEKGEIMSWDKEYLGGQDSRRNYGSKDGAVPCNGDMLFGCSLVGPVEAFLSVNGWPEDLCDGLSSEDYCMGIVMENAGWKFRYNLNMMTMESEEHHHIEPPFKRSDYGVSPNDKSHAALNIARSSKFFPNSFGEGGIKELRRKTLAGEPWPIPKSPDREWFTQTLLSEL